MKTFVLTLAGIAGLLLGYFGIVVDDLSTTAGWVATGVAIILLSVVEYNLEMFTIRHEVRKEIEKDRIKSR